MSLTNVARAALGATATASAVYGPGGYEANRAIDDNESTQSWPGSVPLDGCWLSIDLGSAHYITKYRVLTQFNYRPNGYLLQSSPDNSTWTTRYDTGNEGQSVVDSGLRDVTT